MDKKEYLRNKEILQDQIVQSVKERRNNLFINKNKVPNRKFKFILAVGISIHMIGRAKLEEIRNFFNYKDQELKDVQRKSYPFFQMLNDLDYITLDKRRDAIIESLFEGKKLEAVKNLDKGFIKPLNYFTPYLVRENPQHYNNNREIQPKHLAVGYVASAKYDVFNI